jgi:hyperosmotically inducible protein
LPGSPYDDQIRAALASEIYRELPYYAITANPPIHIIVETGRVTLEGVVRNEVERRIPETIARSTFGVFSVENRLCVGSQQYLAIPPSF